MGYLSRLPNSNDPPRETWEYGPQEPLDDFAAALNGLAKRCSGCKRVTMNRHLIDWHCPVCKNEKEIWHGYPRKVVGDKQACVFPMTYGKGRICIGPKDSTTYDKGY